jgi:hypothetical protein
VNPFLQFVVELQRDTEDEIRGIETGEH